MTRPPGRRGRAGRGPKTRGGGSRRDGGGTSKVGFWAEVFGCLTLVVVGSGLMIAAGVVGIWAVIR